MTFDAERETGNIIRWIKDFFRETNGVYAVIGMSGGKDSTVTAALCSKALGKENVVGVILPNGPMPDKRIAEDACKLYCGHWFVKNIAAECKAVPQTWTGPSDPLLSMMNPGSDQARTNMPARIRMACLYWAAQSVGHGRVANTCNLSEDYVGYATRYGDGAGDFAPLGQYTVQEVKAIGHYLGVPDEMVEKTPSDGLQDKTDEDNLGFTYEMLDEYIRTGKCGDPEVKKEIDRLFELNRFKVRPIPFCNPVCVNPII